jgi:dinuclear metal center YbgI/SA1388 family protein
MTTVSEVTVWLENFAPARLAEPWDNVGLLWGDPNSVLQKVMTCLTVTTVTAAEAIQEQAGLVVSHHPVLFREVKKIRADLPETGYLWSLARAGVAIASPHTAFDNTEQGINEILCRRLGLVDVTALKPPTAKDAGRSAPPQSFKVVVFTPESDREPVLSAAFNAGAGRIGAYAECSFAIPGEGTFFGTEATNPTIGQRGRRESAQELRLEFVCPARQLAAVLAAVRAAHSYEEPAIDVYPLLESPHAASGALGVGRIGRFLQPRTLGEFAAFAGRTLGRVTVGLAGDPVRPVRRVAVACGAGDDFVKDAADAGADVLFTGEARFHRALEAEARGIGLVIAGHYATERLGVEELAGKLALAFAGLTVWSSQTETDPVRWIKAPEL